jgi:hypothetical protein
MQIGSVVVGLSYGTAEFCSRLSIAFNKINGMHQPSINLKTFVSTT